MMEVRKKYKDASAKKGGQLTVTVYILKAVAEALKEYPMFNASLDEATNELVFKEYFNLGVAVDTDAGLIVPVVRDVDKKSLLELSTELKELAEKTRDRKVGAEDLKGGSFTISNLGGIGGTHFTPIVNKPEVAILGLGRGVTKPVVVDGEITPRIMLPIAVSYDHRVIDGADAARFVTALVKALENVDEKSIKI